MKHTLKIKGQEITLTTREARALLDELQAVFGPAAPIIYPMPAMPMPENPFNPPWEITCGPCGVMANN